MDLLSGGVDRGGEEMGRDGKLRGRSFCARGMRKRKRKCLLNLLTGNVDLFMFDLNC